MGDVSTEKEMPELPGVIAGEAEILWKTGKLEEAERLSRSCVERYPWFTAGLMILSHILTDEVKYTEALNYLFDILDGEQVHGPAFKLIGEVFLRMDRLSDARLYLEKALRCSPGNRELEDLLYELADMDFPSGEFDSGIIEEIESFETYRVAVEQEKDEDEEAIRFESDENENIDEGDEESSIEKDKDSGHTTGSGTLTLARIYLEQGYYSKAGEILNYLKSRNPEDPEIEQLEHDLEKKEKADSSWKQIDPGNAD